MEGDQNQKWAAGPHKSKTTQKSKCQVRKASKALSTVQPARPLQRPATKATTKNGLQALKKATQRKEASGKSMSQIQATRSDGENPQVKAQAEGGGREKRLKQKQGTKRIPKTRVHSTLCKAISQPTLTTEELQFYS